METKVEFVDLKLPELVELELKACRCGGSELEESKQKGSELSKLVELGLLMLKLVLSLLPRIKGSLFSGGHPVDNHGQS